jgi:hypothetical protein
MLVTGFLKFELPFFEHRVSIRASLPIRPIPNGLYDLTYVSGVSLIFLEGIEDRSPKASRIEHVPSLRGGPERHVDPWRVLQNR